jgi:hypothetical protein
MRMCRGTGSKMTFLLNSALSLGALTTMEIPIIHWIGFVGFRSSLDMLMKRKFFLLPGVKP